MTEKSFNTKKIKGEQQEEEEEEEGGGGFSVLI